MTLELTGKHFGKLTAVRPDKNQSGKLGRRWVCRCDCGRKTVVRTRDLRTGNTRSCGCLRELKHGFTKRKSKQGYRLEIFADGKWCYSPRNAERYLKVDRHILSGRWRFSCPWLGGKGITKTDFLGPYNKRLTYYLRDDLDEIKRARVEPPLIPEYSGLVYLNDVATERPGARTFLIVLSHFRTRRASRLDFVPVPMSGGYRTSNETEFPEVGSQTGVWEPGQKSYFRPGTAGLDLTPRPPSANWHLQLGQDVHISRRIRPF